MRESSLQSSVLGYLNSLPGCVAENLSGNSAQSGRADISGCIQGKAFRIELKILDHKNQPTAKQLYNLLKWQKAGAAVMVAYTRSDIEACFLPDGLVDHYYKTRGSCVSFLCTRRSDKLLKNLLKEYAYDI